VKKITLFFLIGIYFSRIILAEGPVKLAIVAGMNINKYSSSVFSSHVGFHVGGKTEIVLSKGLYCETGVLLSLKGGKSDWGSAGSISLNPYYLEVPVKVGYKYAINDSFKVFGKFGPYFSFGLFGKEIDSSGPGDTQTYNVFSDQDALKRFDAGVGLNLGFEIKNRFQISIGNDWGFLPVYDSSGTSIDLGAGSKNSNLTISLSYLF